MSLHNTAQLVPLAGATIPCAGPGLTVDGTVLVENGSLFAQGIGSDPGNTAVLGLVNATLYDSGPMWDPSLVVDLMGNSHLQLGPMQFMSPVVLASSKATIAITGIQDFAGVWVNAKTSMVDFVSHSNVVEASLRVYDVVPHTTWSAVSSAASNGFGTVTLGLVHHG